MEDRVRVISHGIPCPASLGDEPDEVVTHDHRKQFVLPLLLVPETGTRLDQQNVARHNPSIDESLPVPVPAEAAAGKHQHQPSEKGPGDPGVHLLRRCTAEQDARSPTRGRRGNPDFLPKKRDAVDICHFFIIFIRNLLFAIPLQHRII